MSNGVVRVSSMARKRQLRRSLTVRVTIPEWELLKQWVAADRSDLSTLIRELIERERRRLEGPEVQAALAAADIELRRIRSARRAA